MIYQIFDVMMIISTWDEVQLWIYLLNHNSLTHQTWSIDRYKQVKQAGWVPGPFQFSKLLKLLKNQLCQVFRVSFFFERMNKRKLNINY